MLKIISFLLLFSSCTSYEKFKRITEELEIPSQIYKSDYNQTWQAVIQVMKKYDIAYQNQEAGKIKTRWIDNTTQINFTDSFGSADAIKAAEFKVSISVAEGYSYGRKVSKVTIYKRQRVEQDFLQGWKETPPDGIFEKTTLYRIGQIIKNDNKLKEIDRAKQQDELDDF